MHELRLDADELLHLHDRVFVRDQRLDALEIADVRPEERGVAAADADAVLEMRAAGEQLLAQYANFTSINATAEATTLADASVDFVTAGQAFHWFDRDSARREFARILKPGGWVVIAWNGFRPEKTAVIAGYHSVLLRYGTDYRDVRREIEDTYVETFFAPGRYGVARFEFQQAFDFEGFKGRLLSASYAPQPGAPEYQPMIADLRRVFDENQQNGTVAFDYDAEVYYGRLS